MIIDDALLSKLERLSALKIPDAKREEFKGQLNNIVDFVEILNELDLQSGEAAITTLKGGTPSLSFALGASNTYRRNIAPTCHGSA